MHACMHTHTHPQTHTHSFEYEQCDPPCVRTPENTSVQKRPQPLQCYVICTSPALFFILVMCDYIAIEL